MKMSRIESGIRTVLAFNEAFNRHDVTGMIQFISDDCIFENSAPAPDGTVYAGKEVITQFWQAFFRESPQAHNEIEDVFGLGYRCVIRWRYDWVDGVGKKHDTRGVDIFKLKKGSIYEMLSYVKGRS